MTVGVDPLGDILKAATDLLFMLVGIPAFLASLLTLLEYFNLITQATADVIQMYSNTALYVACFFAVLFGRADLVILIDHYLGGVNHLLIALIALLTGAYSMIATAHAQKLLRGLAPVQDVYDARIRAEYDS